MHNRARYIFVCAVLYLGIMPFIAKTAGAQPPQNGIALQQSKTVRTSWDFLVIVNSKNSTASIDKKLLADIFFKKVSRWPKSEDVIRPVDQKSDSALRRQFTENVLNRSVAEVKNYWQQKIFAGYDLPPPELTLDTEIIGYVAKYPGAIGYISNDTPIDNTANVKPLTIK